MDNLLHLNDNQLMAHQKTNTYLQNALEVLKPGQQQAQKKGHSSVVEEYSRQVQFTPSQPPSKPPQSTNMQQQITAAQPDDGGSGSDNSDSDGEEQQQPSTSKGKGKKNKKVKNSKPKKTKKKKGIKKKKTPSRRNKISARKILLQSENADEPQGLYLQDCKIGSDAQDDLKKLRDLMKVQRKQISDTNLMIDSVLRLI